MSFQDCSIYQNAMQTKQEMMVHVISKSNLTLEP